MRVHRGSFLCKLCLRRAKKRDILYMYQYFVERRDTVSTSKKVWLIVLSCLAALALTAACVGLVWQHRQLDSVTSELADTNKALEEAQTERDTYKEQADQNEQLQQQKGELEQKLKEAEDKLKASEEEQNKLKEKNAALQQQIELLSANKKPNNSAAAKPIPGKVCYLTFDDGPSNVTPLVLDTLKKYNVKATFFVAGANDAAMLKRIHNEGHALALHCNDHTYAKVYASEAAYFADLNAVSKKVENATGVKSMVVRFPGGTSNTVSRNYTKGLMTTLSKKLPEMGYAYFDWNISSGDASGGVQSASTIASNVIKGAKGKDRICVLMHDGYGKKTTAQALPAIITGLQKQGFSFEVLTTDVEGFKHKPNN